MRNHPVTSEQFVTKIEHWIDNGGRFPDLRNREVQSIQEADVIVRAIKSGDVKYADGWTPNIFYLASLLQSDDSEIRSYFVDYAASPLRSHILSNLELDVPRELSKSKEFDYKKMVQGYLFALQALIRFGYPEDGELLVRAARKPHYNDHYLWSSIFNHAKNRHPKPEEVLNALRNPLPQKFCQIAFLDFSNSICGESNDHVHPFDTDEGFEYLLQLIDQQDEGDDSYILSAAKAAPFLTGNRAQSIIRRIRKHRDKTVRSEAEWAEARLGSDKSKKFLLDKFQTIQFHSRAAKYLSELGIKHPQLKTSDAVRFKALVEYCDWMANEQDFLGFPPKKIKVLNEMKIIWPIPSQTIPFWRVMYKTKDPYDGERTKGVSLVSPVGFSRYYDEKYFEGEEDRLSAFSDAVEFDESYKELVDKWPDRDWCIQRLKELNPKLLK